MINNWLHFLKEKWQGEISNQRGQQRRGRPGPVQARATVGGKTGCSWACQGVCTLRRNSHDIDERLSKIKGKCQNDKIN